MYFPAGISLGRAELEAFSAAISASEGDRDSQIGRVGFLPSGRVGAEHGDGDFRQSLRVPLIQAARVENTLDRFRAGKNSSRGEFVFFRDIDNFSNTIGAKLRSDGCSLREVTRRRSCGAEPILPAGRQLLRRPALARDLGPDAAPSPALSDDSTTRRKLSSSNLFVKARAVRSAKRCADRDDMIFFLDVLMNGVVGEPSEGKTSAGEKTSTSSAVESFLMRSKMSAACSLVAFCQHRS